MADSRPAAYDEAAAPAVALPNVRLLALLSLGHFVIDLMQGEEKPAVIEAEKRYRLVLVQVELLHA